MTTSPSSQDHPERSARRVQLFGKEEFATLFAAWRDRVRIAVEGGAPPRRANAPAFAGALNPPGSGAWALVGIKRRGAVLARRLWNALSTEKSPLLYGEIDFSLYRDDYHLQTEKAMVLGTEISFRVEGVKILLVDDVLFTGRTVRAAMDLLLDFGRPRVISLAVFVDRGHRELPISANLVGREIATDPQDQVLVTLAEMGESDGVELVKKGS